MERTETGHTYIDEVRFEMYGRKFVGKFELEYTVNVTEETYNHNCCADYDSEDVCEVRCENWEIEDWEIYDLDTDELVDNFKYEEMKRMLGSKRDMETYCEEEYLKD